jgi:hypothetical protein
MKINFKPDPKPEPKPKKVYKGIKVKPGYRIPKRSKKRIAEDALYYAEAKQFIKGKKCYIEGCNAMAEGVDHTKGRWGKNLMDKEFWQPCCNFHNQMLENNHEMKKKYHLSKIHGGKLK